MIEAVKLQRNTVSTSVDQLVDENAGAGVILWKSTLENGDLKLNMSPSTWPEEAQTNYPYRSRISL